MRISVVIPSHQHEGSLVSTLESVYSQDHQDLEILVVDCGDADLRAGIQRHWKTAAGGLPIRWVSQCHGGRADAINQGLHACTGEGLAYLNPGDLYCPGALSAVAAHFLSRPNCLALYGQAYQLHPDGSIADRHPTEPWDYDRLLETCFLCQPAVFWRREVTERFGVFDEALRQASDYEYWLRVGYSVPFEYLGGVYLAGSLWSEDADASSQGVHGRLEWARAAKKYSPRPEPVLHWIRRLASQQGHEIEAADPAGRRRAVAAMVAHCLLYADDLEVPLTDAFLEGLENDLGRVAL